MTSSVPPKILLLRVEKAFREYLPQDCDHLLDECAFLLRGCVAFKIQRMIGVKLCQNYDLSVEELFWKWETVKHLSRETHRLDASNLQELKIYVAQEQTKPSKPTNKGSSARLSGMMSARSGAPGYGPGRIPRQLGGSFISGVKREDSGSPFPVAGPSKISFSRTDKVERCECECSTVESSMVTEPVRFQIVTCTRNCQSGVMVGVPSGPKAIATNQISFTKFWTKGSMIWPRWSACTTSSRNFATQPL